VRGDGESFPAHTRTARQGVSVGAGGRDSQRGTERSRRWAQIEFDDPSSSGSSKSGKSSLIRVTVSSSICSFS